VVLVVMVIFGQLPIYIMLVAVAVHLTLVVHVNQDFQVLADLAAVDQEETL
jgi:hypothetical protein